MKKTAVCILSRNVRVEWIDFLNTFENYDTYLIIDEPVPLDLQQNQNKFSKVKTLFIEDKDCEEFGFINMNFPSLKKITSWERGVFYFSKTNTQYDNIWFLEDDVFINNENVLVNIDKKYPEDDLLTSTSDIVYEHDINGWHWDKIEIKFLPPYSKALVACIRVSSNLLSDISNYANEHKTLFFIETLFTSFCLKNQKLKHRVPEELVNSLLYRHHWTNESVNKNNIFHPVKDMIEQNNLRKYLKNKE
jgi:hypothetical protein